MSSKVSVIVPFYKGNPYLPRLFASIEAIVPICREEDTAVEVVLVNDSPDVAVQLPEIIQEYHSGSDGLFRFSEGSLRGGYEAASCVEETGE